MICFGPRRYTKRIEGGMDRYGFGLMMMYPRGPTMVVIDPLRSKRRCDFGKNLKKMDRLLQMV